VSGATDNLSAAEGATPKTALVFLIFLGAGPPLGLLVLMASGIVAGHALSAFSTHDLLAHLRSLGVFAIVSYGLGGIQALFVACVAAISQAMSPMGLLPFLPVLLACLFVSVAYVSFGMVRNQGLPSWDNSLLFAGLHFGSGILCWLICSAVLWPLRRRSDSQVAA
jgi:hypothetical protein